MGKQCWVATSTSIRQPPATTFFKRQGSIQWTWDPSVFPSCNSVRAFAATSFGRMLLFVLRAHMVLGFSSHLLPVSLTNTCLADSAVLHLTHQLVYSIPEPYTRGQVFAPHRSMTAAHQDTPLSANFPFVTLLDVRDPGAQLAWHLLFHLMHPPSPHLASLVY